MIIQDILFFIISTCIIMFGIINILDSSLRLYIFVAIILGSFLHFTFFSKYFLKLYNFLFKASYEIFEFIFLPFKLIIYVVIKVCIKIQKIVKKCCKKFCYMVTFSKKLVKKRRIKSKKIQTKEGI